MIQMELKVLGKVKHDGKWYDSGSTIKKVSEDEGTRLVKMGVVEEVQAAGDKKKANSDKK